MHKIIITAEGGIIQQPLYLYCRSAADFASAIDAIWPLFAAAGCARTSKASLIEKKIIIKVRQACLHTNIKKSFCCHLLKYSPERAVVDAHCADVKGNLQSSQLLLIDFRVVKRVLLRARLHNCQLAN